MRKHHDLGVAFVFGMLLMGVLSWFFVKRDNMCADDLAACIHVNQNVLETNRLVLDELRECKKGLP